MELLPCPFCGDTMEGDEPPPTADPKRELLGWYVECRSCGASTDIFDTIAKSNAAWNRRTTLASAAGAAGEETR